MFFFFFKQKTAYEISACLVGSEMCIRDRLQVVRKRLVGDRDIDEAQVVIDDAAHPFRAQEGRVALDRGVQAALLDQVERDLLDLVGRAPVHRRERDRIRQAARDVEVADRRIPPGDDVHVRRQVGRGVRHGIEIPLDVRLADPLEVVADAHVEDHAGARPGMVFNMSVGYNLEGIRKPNVQWYLDAMADASAYLPAYVDNVARRYPAVRDLDIPSRLSDTVTLSTMHGCPPDEIEKISLYLIEERGLHTSVKCNPTLLGAERVRGIVNDDLGFVDVPIPDEAFTHDLKWADAVPMFHNLRQAAGARGLTFGLKLTNTLEVDNWRTVFERDDRMYLSGRPLHAVTTNLAAVIT